MIILTMVAIAIGFGAVLLLVARDDDHEPATSVIDGIESRSGDTKNPPQRDVVPGMDCSVEIGVLKAGGQLTNHSSDTSTYSLLVAWENNGVRIADATTVIEFLAPGASAEWDATGLGNGNSATTCRIVRIERVKT
jgi:hypothetical protein